MPAKWQYLAGPGQASPQGYYVLNQHPIYGAVSPIASDGGSRSQGVEMGVAAVKITPSDPLATFLLPVSQNFCSAGLEVLVPKGRMLPPRDTIPLNWKLKLPPSHFGLPVRLMQAKKGVTVLLG